MNYHKLVQGILDVGEGMLKCGAENFRLEDSLYRICRSYGFVNSDVFIIPSNMQITVETPEGEIITQIRHIEYRTNDFDRLDQLNDLCRYICQYTPDEIEIHQRYLQAMDRKDLPYLVKCIAGIMGGVGFGVFFGCDAIDALVTGIVAIMIVCFGDWLGKREKNLFTYNLIVCFFAEIMILGFHDLGFGHHSDRIMIGCIMLLISALGLTNGIRDFLACDFISGLLNIMNAVLGAAGIATGIAIAVLIMGGSTPGVLIVNTNIMVQLIACTVGCIGFSYMFNIRGKQVIFSGIGAFLTWGVYCILVASLGSSLYGTIGGAAFVGLYAFGASRTLKAPSTTFLTAAVVPLLPGPHLYFLMEAFMSKNIYSSYRETFILGETSLAIAFGFIIMDILIKIIMSILKKEYRVSKKHMKHNGGAKG